MYVYNNIRAMCARVQSTFVLRLRLRARCRGWVRCEVAWRRWKMAWMLTSSWQTTHTRWAACTLTPDCRSRIPQRLEWVHSWLWQEERVHQWIHWISRSVTAPRVIYTLLHIGWLWYIVQVLLWWHWVMLFYGRMVAITSRPHSS